MSTLEPGSRDMLLQLMPAPNGWLLFLSHCLKRFATSLVGIAFVKAFGPSFFHLVQLSYVSMGCYPLMKRCLITPSGLIPCGMCWLDVCSRRNAGERELGGEDTSTRVSFRATWKRRSDLPTVLRASGAPLGLIHKSRWGAIVKGRAASFQLNRLMRSSMCYASGSDIYSLPMYYNTSSNRADGPTRDDVPAPPDLPLPSWWHSLCQGDARDFDQWLKRVGAPNGESELPFDDICGSQDVDLSTARSEKRKKWFAAKASCSASDACESPLEHMTSEPAHEPVEHATAGSLAAEAVRKLESYPKEQFLLQQRLRRLHKPWCAGFVFGNLWCGKTVDSSGCSLGFEINHRSAEDLLKPEVREGIVRLVRLHAFLACCAAPIRSSFSVAVTPPVRSARFPRGLPGLRSSMREKVRDRNSHKDFCADLLECFESHGVFYMFENPDTSWWWRQKRWKRWPILGWPPIHVWQGRG